MEVAEECAEEGREVVRGEGEVEVDDGGVEWEEKDECRVTDTRLGWRGEVSSLLLVLRSPAPPLRSGADGGGSGTMEESISAHAAMNGLIADGSEGGAQCVHYMVTGNVHLTAFLSLSPRC